MGMMIREWKKVFCDGFGGENGLYRLSEGKENLEKRVFGWGVLLYFGQSPSHFIFLHCLCHA